MVEATCPAGRFIPHSGRAEADLFISMMTEAVVPPQRSGSDLPTESQHRFNQ